jgi:hypothetical protein
MGTEQGGRVDPPGYLFSYCAPNFCGIHCSPQEEEELAAIDMTELWEDLSSTNVTRIRNALTQHPTRVSLNKERKAVQIIGCDHGIIGHVTLREDLFEAVLEVEPDGS